MIREGEPRLLLESALLELSGLWARSYSPGCFISATVSCTGWPATFHQGIEKGQALYQTTGEHGLWIIPAVTTLGPLTFRQMPIYRFAPEAGRSWHGCGRNGVSPQARSDSYSGSLRSNWLRQPSPSAPGTRLVAKDPWPWLQPVLVRSVRVLRTAPSRNAACCFWPAWLRD